MVTELLVLLKGWIVEDGEVPPIREGDRLVAGLGVDVETSGTAIADTPAVASAPSSGKPRGAARAVVTGTAEVIADDDGNSAFDLVTVQPGLHLVLLGASFPAGLAGGMTSVTGIVVFEPYLWGESGILARTHGVGPASGVARSVREIGGRTGPRDQPDHLVTLDLDPQR